MREEIGTILYMPGVLGIIILPLWYFIQGVFFHHLTFVRSCLIVGILEEETH